MRFRFSGLWRHPDFLRLWSGQTVSLFGTLVSAFAIPYIAIVTLDASPFQLALLSVAQIAPALTLGLPAGVWVDRRRRLPLMIAADLGRAVLLTSVPLAAALDRLSLPHLYAVVVLVSALNVLFETAYRSYLPTLVRRGDLVDANAKLQASASVAEVAGFGLGGLLVQALTAPLAVVVDAASFVVSATSLRTIRAPEPEPSPTGGDVGANEAVGARRPAWRELGTGFGHLWRDPRLRGLGGSTALFELSRSSIGVVILLFFFRDLDLAPGLAGPIAAIGGLSALLGAVVAAPIMARMGVGRTLAASLVVAGLGAMLVAAAREPLGLIVLVLALSQMSDGAATIANIGQTSLVQGLTPDRLLGRVVASFGVLERGSMLVGILVGGLLGEEFGARTTIALAGCGIVFSGVWAYVSPVRTVERIEVGPLAAEH